MRCPYTACTQLGKRVTRLIAHHGVTLLRVSPGAVFLWWGVLKLLTDLSPAQTVDRARARPWYHGRRFQPQGGLTDQSGEY
jgi:hypothetical protein